MILQAENCICTSHRLKHKPTNNVSILTSCTNLFFSVCILSSQSFDIEKVQIKGKKAQD